MATARNLFRKMHSEARKALNLTKENPAFWAREAAEYCLIHEYDSPIEETIQMGRAVLYSIHWAHCEPSRDVPKNRSEVHRCFEADENHCRVWFTSPGEMIARAEARAGVVA